MNIRKILGRFFILLISISMLFCSCGKTLSTDGSESQTEDKDTWTVVLNGTPVSDVRVVEYEDVPCLSVADMLLACGYSFDWESEYVARVEKNDQLWIFNREEKSMCREGADGAPYMNRIMAPDGATKAYIFNLDGEMFADYAVTRMLLLNLHESSTVRVNYDEKIIRFITREQAEQERAEIESME